MAQVNTSQLPQVVLSAITTLQTPGADLEQRRQAVLFLEQDAALLHAHLQPHLQHTQLTVKVVANTKFKQADVSSILAVCQTLMQPVHLAEVRMGGYKLLTDLIKGRWSELDSQQQPTVSNLAYQQLQQVDLLQQSPSAWPLKAKVAELVAAVLRQRGADAYNEVLPLLTSAGVDKPAQAEVSCMILHFISEDLTQFENAASAAKGDAKRAFLSALTASVGNVFPYLCLTLEQHFQAAVAAMNIQNLEAMKVHSTVISAALAALAHWVEWVPLPRITASPTLPACTYFLGTVEFRLAALEVLRQIVGRKKSTETLEDYCGLMAAVASTLLTSCASMGLLQPPRQPLPRALVEQLDFEGPLEEFGKRLADTLAVLGENHFRCIPPGAPQLQFLQQMLVFTRHPFMLLSSVTLPMWLSLLKDSQPSQSQSSQQLTQPPQASSQDHPPNLQPSHASRIPPDCCAALIQAVAEQLPPCVMLPDASLSDFPPFFDSHAEYKEFCANYRGQAKLIIRQAALLAPEQGLNAAHGYLTSALSLCQDASRPINDKIKGLQSAVHVISAVMPPLVELAAQQPALLQALVQLLQLVLSWRLPEPQLMTLHAEAMEAFGKLLALQPALGLPVLQAAMSAMMQIPLEAPGHMPPPVDMTPAWKESFEARLSMCTAVVAICKVSPASLAPHLPSLVSEVQALWDRGALREAERVVLWEGFLAASTAVPREVQAQLVQLVLAPVHRDWTSPEFQSSLSSPQAFLQACLPLQGPATLGNREKRWTLYHQLTLVQRVILRTAAPEPTPTASAQPAANGGSQPSAALAAPSDHPFNVHLEWALPPVARILAIIHQFFSPQVRTSLGPLAILLEMDPVERAFRLGEDRDLAKERRAPRCVAGTNLMDAWYFVRGLRECVHMILSLAGAHCNALWMNAKLADGLPPLLCTGIEHVDHSHLRLLLRHVYSVWSMRCLPAGLRTWIVPICRTLLPHMHNRLVSGWAAITQQAPRAGPQSQSNGAPSKVADENEVVTDSLLREVTREHMHFLTTLTRHTMHDAITRPGSPQPSTPPLSPAGSRRASEGATPTFDSVFELLLQHEPAVAQAGFAVGVAALGWPDADAIAKAVAVCRFLVCLAADHPEIEAYVCGELMPAAVRSLAQVSTLTVQHEVLGLIRAILVSPRLSAHPACVAVLQSLPGVTPAALAEFRQQLASTGSEKDQRAIIKALIAQAGGEEVRQVLSAVSKIPDAPVAVSEPRPRVRPTSSPHDEQLGGEIFRALFSDG